MTDHNRRATRPLTEIVQANLQNVMDLKNLFAPLLHGHA